jgi:hypothetical protein
MTDFKPNADVSPSLYRDDLLQVVPDAKVVTDAAIAERAYAKFVARGSVDGYDREDWAAANQELIAQAT